MWKKKSVVLSSVLAFALSFASVSVSPASAADAEAANVSITAEKVVKNYEEGVDYEIRSEKTLTQHKEIREFFSFWCGHCFALQPVFHAVAQAIPEADFVRNPVMMLGGPMGPESQRALVVAANLGLEDEFVEGLFKSMHKEGKIPRNHAEMSDLMTTLGIPRNIFEREYSTFPVLGKVSQYDKWAKDINLDAVPELLINGKYLILMEQVNNDQELIDVIRYVLSLDNLPDARK